jgi:Homeodomain-like domain-containing protein
VWLHASLAHANIALKPVDRRRLSTVARDRNAPHKHVWRAEIVLLSADGVGTNEIMRRTGKSKTYVWRWQERFMQAGYDGLLRDKTGDSPTDPFRWRETGVCPSGR